LFKFNQSKHKWVVFEEKEEKVSMVVVVWRKEIGVGRLATVKCSWWWWKPNG